MLFSFVPLNCNIVICNDMSGIILIHHFDFIQTIALRLEEAHNVILPLLGGFSNVLSVFGVYDK